MENKKEEIVVSGKELSYDTKTIIAVICLVTVYPIGLVLMFAWMKWKVWVKVLISLPLILALFLPLFLLLLASMVAIKLGDDFSKPETIREIRRLIEVTPTEMVGPSVTVKPTMRVVK